MDEQAISRLAARQRGVVTAEQLRRAGFDRHAVKRRCRAGRLHRLHRGVYLVGHAVMPEFAAEMAAVLACGAGSVVSHRSAAGLWRLPLAPEQSPAIDISIAGRDPGLRTGITLHRVRALEASDTRRVAGIPVTAPARTLLDLAGALPFDDLEVAFLDARSRRLLGRRDLAATLARNASRPGVLQFRRLVELDHDTGLTRSEAERALLALVRAAGLPEPKANARVAGLEVDFLWPSQHVVVEVDGFAFHAGRQAFERDRERDAILAARGYVVLRVTWRQLIARREAVAARIAAALAIRG
jgi:very-short-patch-repair endonuclease